MGRLVHKRPMIHMNSESVWVGETVAVWTLVIVFFLAAIIAFVPGVAEMLLEILDSASNAN